MIPPRQVRRRLAAPIARAAQTPDANRYRKHFTTTAHLWMLVSHGLSASPSLRQTHATLAADPAFWITLGLPATGISRSQFARSSTSRPVECFETLFAVLRDQLPRSPDRHIHLIDSSFLTLSGRLAPWSRYRGHVPGVRLHAGIDLGTGVPSHVHVTEANVPDIAAWRARDWDALRGWTVLMDRGYYGHRTFAAMGNQGISWICPLHPQARVTVTGALAGPWLPTPAGDVILADAVITLGSPNNRKGTVLDGLRLVTSRNADGAVHHLVTDRGDLPAGEVVMLYRKRWQIELVSRFLKHQLGVLHPLGYSPPAVILTLLLAAIIAIILVLLGAMRPAHISTIAWARMLSQVLYVAILHDSS